MQMLSGTRLPKTVELSPPRSRCSVQGRLLFRSPEAGGGAARLGDHDSGSGRFIQARSFGPSRWTGSGHEAGHPFPAPGTKAAPHPRLCPTPGPQHT